MGFYRGKKGEELCTGVSWGPTPRGEAVWSWKRPLSEGGRWGRRPRHTVWLALRPRAHKDLIESPPAPSGA